MTEVLGGNGPGHRGLNISVHRQVGSLFECMFIEPNGEASTTQFLPHYDQRAASIIPYTLRPGGIQVSEMAVSKIASKLLSLHRCRDARRSHCTRERYSVAIMVLPLTTNTGCPCWHVSARHRQLSTTRKADQCENDARCPGVGMKIRSCGLPLEDTRESISESV